MTATLVLPSEMMPATPAARFGAEVKKRRLRLGWSQPDLAAHVASVLGRDRMSQSGVAAWESGENTPAPETAFAIEKALLARPGELSRLLGFVPVTSAPPPETVEEAVMKDSALSPVMKRALLAAYRELKD